MRTHLNAAEVAELAELLDDAPLRLGVVDEVLQAAAEGRGMTLRLQPARPRLAATPDELRIEPHRESRRGNRRT